MGARRPVRDWRLERMLISGRACLVLPPTPQGRVLHHARFQSAALGAVSISRKCQCRLPRSG